MRDKELEEKIVIRNNKIIIDFIEQYAMDQNPIEVNFRELFPDIKVDRYTHLIHSYPAKLLVHIPFLFLNNTILSNKKDNVLDPFNGSGTVLLEGVIAGRNSFGADSNPLARLISESKVCQIDAEILMKNLKNILTRAKKDNREIIIPEVVNQQYWFSEQVTISLSKILRSINGLKNNEVKNFMMVSFSNCVKKVSFADPRISVPVKLNLSRYESGTPSHSYVSERLRMLENVDVFARFEKIVNDNIKRVQELNKVPLKGLKAQIISSDARCITTKVGGEKKRAGNSIQLIITSPPYAGAQKYIRASSLNLGWTQLAGKQELSVLDKMNIGRESVGRLKGANLVTGIKDADLLINKISLQNSERANIVSTYLLEMKDALTEMIRVLKVNGFLVLIVGNNKVCEQEFNTQEFLTSYLLEKGLKLKFKLIDDIKSYGLMTKRNKTADIISREWILVFEKIKK